MACRSVCLAQWSIDNCPWVRRDGRRYVRATAINGIMDHGLVLAVGANPTTATTNSKFRHVTF
jgi:hypothetical protein